MSAPNIVVLFGPGGYAKTNDYGFIWRCIQRGQLRAMGDFWGMPFYRWVGRVQCARRAT